jgi:LPS O-antigen subunit length determinant protein (WzzB/FepE family)
MKRNTQNNEIVFDKFFIKALWKNKVLIFFFSIAFMIIGYIYGAFQPKYYKTELKLNDLPITLFYEFESFGDTKKNINDFYMLENFKKKFKSNLLSIDNLSEFLQQSKDFENFRNYQNNNNINPKIYFKDKLKVYFDQNNSVTSVSLIFEKKLDGEQFINKFVMFSFQKAVDDILKIILSKTNSDISLIKIEIANSENSISDPGLSKNSLYAKLNYQNYLYKLAKNFKINYEPILDAASSSHLISKPPLIFSLLGFFLGMFICIIILFIRFNADL